MAASVPKLTYIGLATITKIDKSEDGEFRTVYGKATDETLDGDKQIVDLTWARKALKDWLASGGNLRVQHNPMLYPAGVGIEVNDEDDAAWVRSKVGEPTAIKLLDMGALTSYSVGIANPKVVFDPSAKNGRIVGGEIVEVSLVDRPANPSCGIKVVKAADGEFSFETIEKRARPRRGKKPPEPDRHDDVPHVADAPSATHEPHATLKVEDGNEKSNHGQHEEVLGGASSEGPHSRKSGQRTLEDGNAPGGTPSDVQVAKGLENLDGHKAPPFTAEDAANARKKRRHKKNKNFARAVRKAVRAELKKRDRASDGTFSSRSNPLKHDPSHHDDVSPDRVVGSPEYSGEAKGTTPTGKRGRGSFDEATERQYDDAEHERLSGTPPRATNPRSIKGIAPDRVAWMIGDESEAIYKSDVSTKRKREGAKYVLHDSNGKAKYPINDCSDVHDAWQLRGRSNIDKDTVARHVRRAAKKLGCEIPGTQESNKYRAAVKKMRAMRKELNDLRAVKSDQTPLLTKVANLEEKLEKIGSQPTLGTAIRKALIAEPPVRTKVVTPDIAKAAQAAQHEQDVEFLENISTWGTAEQQDLARKMLRKLQKTT